MVNNVLVALLGNWTHLSNGIWNTFYNLNTNIVWVETNSRTLRYDNMTELRLGGNRYLLTPNSQGPLGYGLPVSVRENSNGTMA